MARQQSMQVDGRFWFAAAGPGSIGHGRVELLQQIHRTGSISQAARGMRMSYKAAWDAVDAMNNLADAPLVERSAGGRHGGGTRLTPQGLRLIEVYRAAEQEFRAFLERLGTGIADFEHFYALMRRLGMKTSARNQFGGRIKSIRKGAVNSEVVLDIGGDEVVAVITNASVRSLGLKRGTPAYALIKASWVILAAADEAQKTSARNRLCGKVAELRKSAVNAEVVLALSGGKRLTAVITNASVETLALSVGAPACALIKASHVIVAIDV
ncbi:MAG: TOBE domain-containing protein [Gammaproteobacteria bacterium]|nr:TOBE domain-containing protein [Gammaproteobacteria bacterium]